MKEKRPRRTFDAALKIEMVRRTQERSATGVPVSVIAAGLRVRPEQLRSRAKQLTARDRGLRSVDLREDTADMLHGTHGRLDVRLD